MTPKNRINSLIFDFDGVIADTEPLHWRSWAASLAPLGINLTWDQYCEFGRGVRDARMLETLRKLVQDPSMLPELDKRNALRKRIMRELCISRPPIHEATIEMLLTLRGYRLGLVTSSEKCDVQPVLRAAGICQCFDAQVFGGDVARHKPAPDPYLLVGRRLGIKAGFVFEDSGVGIISAQQAGFTAVLVTEPEQLSRIVYREIFYS
jgi:beta-phosphoglucomutase